MSAVAVTAPEDDRTAVAGVADRLSRLMRMFNRARAQLVAAAEQDVERSAHLLLRHLQHEGPMRAGTIAETLHSDPSTVSRQVAALVKDGLLERRADPEDGRASLLVLTDRAQAVLGEHNRHRLDYFERILTDWTEDEIRDFGGMLERFTTAYEAAMTDWTPPRLAERAVTPRSTAR